MPDALVALAPERKRAEKALQDANAKLESFAYSVSHDLRAPLRAIDGCSRAVLEDHGPRLPKKAQHDLQCVRAGAQQMARLIDDLLAFARLSRQPLRKHTIQPRELLTAAWAELAGDRHGRNVTLNIANLPPCQADPTLLKQVWTNLLYGRHQQTRRPDWPRHRVSPETVYIRRPDPKSARRAGHPSSRVSRTGAGGTAPSQDHSAQAQGGPGPPRPQF